MEAERDAPGELMALAAEFIQCSVEAIEELNA